MQLKYSNYAAFSHVHGVAVNNSGQSNLLYSTTFPPYYVVRYIESFILSFDIFHHLSYHIIPLKQSTHKNQLAGFYDC